MTRPTPRDPRRRPARPTCRLGLGLLLLGLLGCVSSTPDADRSQVMSVVSPGRSLRAGSRVALLPGSETRGDTAESHMLGGMIESAIRHELLRLGFRAAGPGAPADLHFAYLAVETSQLDARESLARFGILTNETYETSSLPTGTMLVTLVDAHTRVPIWRASTQAELHRDASPEQRRARVELHVARLFATCPAPTP